MKNNIIANDQKEVKTILPFEIKQALIALELGLTDSSLLKYIDFLSGSIPITGAHFTHVIPKIDFYKALYDEDAPSLKKQFKGNSNILHRIRDKVSRTSIGHSISHLSFDVFEGDPLERVLKQVDEIKADLLVIGQKAHTKSHAILAKNLARKTKGNVLIIPEHAQTKLKTILVPIDFSKSAIKALETALGIYKRMEGKARIICLYIYSVPDFNTFRFDQPWIQLQGVVESNIKDAFAAFLNTYACQEQDCIETAMVFKETSDTGSHIINYAESQEADMIVMGAKGHSKVQLLLMGSVAEKVISLNSNRPTLLVR